MVRIKSTAGPWCLVVDCLGEVSRQALGNALLRTTGPVDGRSLAEDGRSHGNALARSDDLSLCGNATQMADELSRGLAAACHLHAAACLGPPCRSLVNGSPRADALLPMPREPPGLLLCLPSIWPWPLRICETALRCSSSNALGKHDRALFQNLIENLRPATVQEGRPASYARKSVKAGPYKVDGRALAAHRN